MALDDVDDACVYVKESVLRELEQERRRLKWQLSRALQTSDVRAAELDASKAKVKDLLTIVEVNKGVADQAVQRSQGREAQRRAELESLHQQSKQQRQRYVDLALRMMNRRVRDRQQRDAFQTLQHALLMRGRRREAILKLLARHRRRVLRRGLDRWRRYCVVNGESSGSAKVHPLVSGQLTVLTRSTHPMLIGSDSMQFVRWQLLRKVWRNWERVVRWKRRHREFVRLASERLLRLVIAAWRSRARLVRQQKVLVRRVLARTSHRIQQLGLTSLRLRCAEVSAHEWSEVLKTAHVAMEEERKLREEVQSSAASELHAAYIREQQRQQRFTELQTQRLEDFKRRECKHRTLMMLRCEVLHTRQKNAIALRFQRLQHLRRETRRLFTSWKRVAGRARRVKRAIAAWDARRDEVTKANCFRLFAHALKRRRQQRFRLRALLSKLRRAWLLRGWVCLRIRSAVAERNAIAHVELWQFTQRADAMRTACQEEIRRSRRVALKYQITCALLMADKKHEKLLRRVFCAWFKRAATSARQRRALRRLAARKREKTLRAALQLWGHFNDGKAVRCNQLHRYHLTRRLRALQVAFDAWRRSTHERLRLRLAHYQQRSCFRAWRQFHRLQQQRVRWFGQFIQRSTDKRRRQAFQSWRQKHDHYVKLSARREDADHELIARLWRRWIGFVAFRLHKRQSQQQRALSGLRSALQRTIVATAFTSWQTHWRRSRSRGRAIVRAFRNNISHARGRKCLQVWHHHSALMARRRAALRGLNQRRNLQRLRNKWQRWIRASLCDIIATLQTSTLRAQERVDSVLQSMTRSNALRRMMRKWRSIAAESKRRQRRRALFAEKRRYMALQASMRQWRRKITSSPLTKQHRVLQHLLNTLRLSVERQAFRLWERRAHKQTLFERDRVSAELFRRSENRVMALAEEIQAERERRLVFTSWRSLAARRRKAREDLQSIASKQQLRLLQCSWNAWMMHTQTHRCLERLVAIVTRRLKAAAWSKLMDMRHQHDQRSTGARRAGLICRKVLLHHAWNHWKRIDSLQAKDAALTEAQASLTKSILAFKETLAMRHHKKRCQTLAFAAWKRHLHCRKRLQRRLRDVLERRIEATTAWHFQKWRTLADQQNQREQLIHRAVRRHQARELRVALDRWSRWTLVATHQQHLQQTQLAMSRQREATAQRIAAVKFWSWQRPCLEAHFARWKVFVEQRRRYIVEQKIALAQRCTRRLLRSVWCSWRALILQSKRRVYLLAKMLSRARLKLLDHGFYRWVKWSTWVQHADDKLIRLIRVFEVWRWRRGLSALRHHHHEIIRHQSVVAAASYSVHSARQRERQAKVIRGITLVLQRKIHSDLCTRCFRQWIRYAKAKAKEHSMIRQRHERSRERSVRRCFINWQQFTRRRAILQRKLRRRQELWESRRRRRIWTAWMVFTHRSVDVKHFIFDRLVVCAIQDAWVRWKSYTKHANCLLEAERVAHWQHAAAERDNHITALEDKHENLLLRTAQLGQQNNALRQRLVSAAARKLYHMVELGRKSRVSLALKVWRHKLRHIQALQSQMKSSALRYQRLALRHWQYSTAQLRAADAVRRVQLDATEWAARVVHACALQWLKRRVFLSWKSFTRICRGIKRQLAASERLHNHKLVQNCWASWKSVLETRAQQESAIAAMQMRKRLKTLLQTYWQWRGVYNRTGLAKQNALRLCLLIQRSWEHRRLVHGWNSWRSFAVEADAAMLHSNLVLAELEHQNAVECYSHLHLLLNSFTNWKLYIRSQRERREGCTRAVSAASHRRTLHLYFYRWGRRTALNRTRLVLLRRMNRHLRRHYNTLTKFALWMWFSRVRADSRALRRMTTQLQVASKQFTTTTDIAARIARALFTDLLVAEHQLLRSQQRSAWKVVNATARSAIRRQLRTAFDRLASGSPAASRTGKRRFLTPMLAANARAFVDKLTSVLLRSGFERWKRQFLALAIQEAEEAQQELLRALHHVTTYRQALGTYAN